MTLKFLQYSKCSLTFQKIITYYNVKFVHIHVILTNYNKYKEYGESPLRHRKVYVRVEPNIPVKE